MKLESLRKKISKISILGFWWQEVPRSCSQLDRFLNWRFSLEQMNPKAAAHSQALAS